MMRSQPCYLVRLQQESKRVLIPSAHTEGILHFLRTHAMLRLVFIRFSLSMSSHLDTHKGDFQAVIDHYHKELQSLRTGRASVGLVEGIRVEAYGSTTDLKSVASLTTPDAKTIQIEPWDKSMVKEIEKGLIQANLGMMPNVAGTVIRLVMPPMTEETRKTMVKTVNNKEEEAKISVRNIREKIKAKIQDDEKNKVIGEDDKRRQLEALDKAVVDYNKKLEELTAGKEKEIMTI